MKEMARGINELGKGYVRRVGKAEYLEKKGEASGQRRLDQVPAFLTGELLIVINFIAV